MRIAFFTPEYPSERNFAGGLATYLKRTALCLRAAGHDPEIFTVSDTSGRVVDDGVVVHRVKGGIGSYTVRNRVNRSRFGPAAQVFLNPLKLYLRFLREHFRNSFDVVQVPNFQAAGYFAAKFKFIPVVTRISSYEPLLREAYGFELDAYRASLEKVELEQIKASDGVYAPSRLTARILKERESLDIEVINPPVELVEPAWAKDSSYGTYALFFGSIGPLKGCSRLLDVLPRLLEKHPDYRFMFAGTFRHEAERVRYDLLTRDQFYAGRVMVLKEQRRDDLFRLIGNARYVVLPSRIDNFPNTCIEAMLLRKVVVGTHEASFDEIIDHGVNGYLISQTDDDELFMVMDLLWRMEMPSLERMGDRAREALRKLAPEITINRLIAYYQQVIVKKNA